MAGNTFGKLFQLTTFGESHGAAIGGVIDGVPGNFLIDIEAVQQDLDRRRPGQSRIVTHRKESDTVEFLSGIFEGRTTGTSIAFIIKNEDARSKDYAHIKDAFRPSHADFTYEKKYGHRDYRGGGRSSARETACRVVAGALAKQILAQQGIHILAFVDQVGSIKLPKDAIIDATEIEKNLVRCPDQVVANEMITLIEDVRKQGDTIGGCVKCIISGVPVGLGEPVFDKLHADLGKAIFSINAVKGFEYGSGFDSVMMRGTEHNDAFTSSGKTVTNFSGGIQGGISNGNDIYFRAAFKPVATVMHDQVSINNEGEPTVIKGKGRHDPCVVPRAVVIVEAMAAITILDHLFRHNAYKLDK